MTDPAKAPNGTGRLPWRRIALIIGAMLGFFLAVVLVFSLLRGPVVRLLADLSDHSARRLALLLGATYAGAGICGFVALRLRHRIARALLWTVFGAVALGTMLIAPGRNGRHPAEQIAAADGTNAAFGSVLSWMALSALLAWVVVGLFCFVLFEPHKVWRMALAVLLWVGTCSGVTALVIHANAQGRAGDKPQSILAYLARVQPAGSTLFGIHKGAPGVKFTVVRHLEECAPAARTLVDPPTALPKCRDALQLEGTGWTRAKEVDGGFSCVLFAPDLGEGYGDWKSRLGEAGVARQPAGGGHRSEVSYGQTYDDGTRVWFTCAERRGTLPAGSTGAPLIADVTQLVVAADLGLL